MSEHIIQLFNFATQTSRAAVHASGMEVVEGWWLLNEQDAWDFISALAVAPNSQPWQTKLLPEAREKGIHQLRVKICGWPIRCIYPGRTSMVLRGAKKD